MIYSECRRCRACLYLWLAVTLAAALAGAAPTSTSRYTQSTVCGSSAAAHFNFFPPNIINIPDGWTKQNQLRAGNQCNGQLMPIALYGAPKPLLHFQPLHELLTLGAAVSDAHQWGIQPQSPPAKQSSSNSSSSSGSSSGSSNAASKLEQKEQKPSSSNAGKKSPTASIASFSHEQHADGRLAHMATVSAAARPAATVPAAVAAQAAAFSAGAQYADPQPEIQVRPAKTKGLFGLPKVTVTKKTVLSPAELNQVLQTFIQVLVTGNTPEITAPTAESSVSTAAVGSTGGGRQQPLRIASVKHQDGSVQQYASRDRILLEDEQQQDATTSSSSSSSSSSDADVDSASSSGSRTLSAFGDLLGRFAHVSNGRAQHADLQEKGQVQSSTDVFGYKGGKSHHQAQLVKQALQAQQASTDLPGITSSAQVSKHEATVAIAAADSAAGGAKLPGMRLPWGKDQSSVHNAAASGKPLARLTNLLPGLSKQEEYAFELGSFGYNSTASTNSSNSSSSSVVLPQWTVVRSADYIFSVEMNNKTWFTSAVHGPNATVAEIDFQGNMTANRRDLFDPVMFVEGINTMVIHVTLLQNTAVVTNGTHNQTGPPASITFSSAETDFYFFMWGNATHDSRPSAVVEFESCRTEAAIRISKARPTPVLIEGYRLTYKPVPDRTTAFFLPVYHIYGQFQKGLDGSTDLRTDNTEGNIKNFGLYITRLPGSPSNFSFTGPQLDALKEGWWQFTVEGSLWVPLPHLASLLSLSGIDRYGNSDVLYREVQPNGQITDGMSLLNSVKGAGWVLPEYSNMKVGLQKAVTVLDYFEGPSVPMVLGDKATFSWQWTGLDSGNTQCKIEGTGTVSLTGNCSSPLTYTVRSNLNQTLILDYTDVCRKRHNASLTFAPSFGWHVEAKELGQGDIKSISGSGSHGDKVTMHTKNSSSGLRVLGAAGVWLRAAGMAVALWLLLNPLGFL